MPLRASSDRLSIVLRRQHLDAVHELLRGTRITGNDGAFLDEADFDVQLVEEYPVLEVPIETVSLLDENRFIDVETAKQKVYDACNQVTAIRFMDDVLRRLPCRVLVVETDNGRRVSITLFTRWMPWTFGTSTSARGRHTSMVRSNNRTGWTTRSSTSSSTRTASQTTSICSTRSSGSGRITAITTGGTGLSTDRPRAND